MIHALCEMAGQLHPCRSTHIGALKVAHSGAAKIVLELALKARPLTRATPGLVEALDGLAVVVEHMGDDLARLTLYGVGVGIALFRRVSGCC